MKTGEAREQAKHVGLYMQTSCSRLQDTLNSASKSPLCVLILARVIVFTPSPTHWMYTNLTVAISSTTSVCTCEGEESDMWERSDMWEGVIRGRGVMCVHMHMETGLQSYSSQVY